MAAVETITITESKKKGYVGQWLEKNDSRIKDFRYSVRLFLKSPLAVLGLLIVVFFVAIALLAPYVAPSGDMHINMLEAKLPPSLQHFFGTDGMGGDVFSRIMWGGRISLSVGFAVVASAVVLGAIIGGISGYFGGVIDELMMRITDIFLAFPYLIFAMVICTALGRSPWNIMIALAITWWPGYARIIRGQALAIREQKYIESAKAIGGTDLHIILRHLLPNSFSPIIIQSTMDLGNVILSAAGLSFIGFGAQPGTAEWGIMVSDGAEFMLTAPWIVTFTGLAILVACLGFNLFGDGLRDILDPKLRR